MAQQLTALGSVHPSIGMWTTNPSTETVPSVIQTAPSQNHFYMTIPVVNQENQVVGTTWCMVQQPPPLSHTSSSIRDGKKTMKIHRSTTKIHLKRRHLSSAQPQQCSSATVHPLLDGTNSLFLNLREKLGGLVSTFANRLPSPIIDLITKAMEISWDPELFSIRVHQSAWTNATATAVRHTALHAKDCMGYVQRSLEASLEADEIEALVDLVNTYTSNITDLTQQHVDTLTDSTRALEQREKEFDAKMMEKMDGLSRDLQAEIEQLQHRPPRSPSFHDQSSLMGSPWQYVGPISPVQSPDRACSTDVVGSTNQQKRQISLLSSDLRSDDSGYSFARQEGEAAAGKLAPSSEIVQRTARLPIVKRLTETFSKDELDRRARYMGVRESRRAGVDKARSTVQLLKKSSAQLVSSEKRDRRQRLEAKKAEHRQRCAALRLERKIKQLRRSNNSALQASMVKRAVMTAQVVNRSSAPVMEGLSAQTTAATTSAPEQILKRAQSVLRDVYHSTSTSLLQRAKSLTIRFYE